MISEPSEINSEASLNRPEPSRAPFWRSGIAPEASEKGSESCDLKPEAADLPPEWVEAGPEASELPREDSFYMEERSEYMNETVGPASAGSAKRGVSLSLDPRCAGGVGVRRPAASPNRPSVWSECPC